MRSLPSALLSSALLLAACAATVEAPAGTDLSLAVVARSGAAPPARPEGACWAAATLPAVFETVTTQVVLPPAAPAGADAPATIRTDTRQAMVSDRRDVWIRTVCDPDVTPDLIASLQRALKARGVYPAAVTGVADAATEKAIRAWQARRGLDSDVLALATAQAFGLVPGVF